MGRRRWAVNKLNKELAARIAEQFSLDPFAALLMSQRCPDTEESVSDYLCRELSLSDPFLIPDMQAAVDRINDAIFDYEKICVYGDYDADGVTATALLYSYLEAQGANVTYMLPERESDGYGLSKNVVDRIHATGTKLIVTVDNGIAAIEEAKYIKELGMELIVTDHHLPGDALPDCIAVVDPHRADAECPFCEFAGVGVTFKLACAIEGNADTVLYDFAELVAIGTVADIVPLIGENRVLVKHGLSALNSYPHPGIAALASVCGFSGKRISSSNISFGLAPRINAAGRMGGAEKALDLLLCEEPEAAELIATELDAVNAERHKAENLIFAECGEFLNNNPEFSHMPVLVVSGDGWHEGVLGIVASKLLERYLRPVIVLSKKDGILKGSARSVTGFSIFEALSYASDCLLTFGGHAQAAGLSLSFEKLDEFITAVNEYAYKSEQQLLGTEDIKSVPYPEINISCKLNSETMSVDLLSSIEVLEPFGASNESPVFGLFDMVIDGIETLGDKKQHLRITAHKNGKAKTLTMMKFNTPRELFPYENGSRIDAAVTLERNVWRDEVKLSVFIKDVRPSGVDDDEMVKSEKLFDKVFLQLPLSAEQASYAMPDRSLFAGVYTYIRAQGAYNINCCEHLLSVAGSETDNLCKVRVALLALSQLGLITADSEGNAKIANAAAKVDLFSAPVMTYLNKERR